MKKLYFILLLIVGFSIKSNSQVVIYNIPVTDLIGMQLNGGDFCFNPNEQEQAVVGNTWGFTWTSTNGNVPSSVVVDIFFSIEEAAGPYPTTLNGFADAPVNPAFASCGFSNTPYTLNPANYNPLAVNTYLMDYAASIQDNQIIDALGGGIFALVTVDYCQPTVGIDPLTACDSLTWTDGITYYVTNNTAKDTLVNAAGCDSIVTLDLAVNYSSAGTDTRVECDSLLWIDNITYYTNNTTATHTVTNFTGCDSLVTLNLTVNTSPTATDSLVACDSLTWIDGNTYFASNNTATHLIPIAIGCDSIISLDLTINNSSSSTDIIAGCDSITWIDGNTYSSANNTATHTIPNAMGCDSIVTLNLTISISPTAIDSLNACDSLTWIDGNTYSTSNNTATHNIPNAIGCDSIIILNLSIFETPIVTIGAFGTDTVCEADNPIFLPNGNPTGGTYSGNGVTGGMFDPSLAGLGFHYVYFSFGDSLGCLGVDSTQITVSTCGVGINENSLFGQVNIYPNPTNDIINVSVANGGSPINFTLLSIDGKVVYQVNNVTEKTVAIDISNNSKGIYFLRVATNNDFKVYKVVKQ